ncbi:ABC transporter permease [Luteimonas sp. WGS1318]|uniref:ABC transporter permease n=1 Tax=Luteimonas sp. WGS1318 TaxID=3366815 RepID=UPI00372D7FF1
MFGYYLTLALRSFRNSKVLTALMVLAIALGIGACMTTLTVFYVLAGDPIPHKSSVLFYPQIEPRTMSGFTPGDDPSEQMTRFDAEALLRDARADRQALMTGGGVAVESEDGRVDPFIADARYTTADFFPMFDVPFRYGGGWNAGDDEARARVLVISAALNDTLFDGADSVGRTLMVSGAPFRVLGVMDDWRPTPKFYDMTNDRFNETEQIFIPFWTSRAMKLGTRGDMSCWGDSSTDEEGSTGASAPCAWLQYWVELGTPDKVDAYRQYLVDYSDQQRAAGRFERPTNVRLHGVMDWLDENDAVPADVRLQVWLALGFLAVCLLNTVGLLLAKFLGRASQIGVRRALGATRRAIFAQCLVEAGTVGLAGGLLGLALSWLGLWAVRRQPADYAALAHMDVEMLLTTFLLAIGASLLAGLLPAWRAMQVTPAIQLKSQ